MKNGMIAELQDRVWAMEPRALDAFFKRVADLELSADDLVKINAENPSKKRASRMQVAGNVAMILVSGILLKTVPSWFSFFGIEATGYDEIQADLGVAVADQDVERIILMVDSPGGDVAGLVEAADAIFAARSVKQVDALVEDLDASGAYWLSAQADTIASGRNAMIGSIGVYTVYVDYSKALGKDGIEVKVIRSGEHKGMGVTGAPITDKQVEAVQDVIDKMAGNFKSAIARGRDMKIKAIENIATGRMWIAGDALALGLIDGIRNPEAKTLVRNSKEEKSMKDLTIGTLKAERPDLVESIDNAARVEAAAKVVELDKQLAAIDETAIRAEGRAEGVAVERERVLAIRKEAADLSKGEFDLNDAVNSAIESGLESDKAALELNRAALEALRSESAKSAGPNDDPNAEVIHDPAESNEEKAAAWEAEWAKNKGDCRSRFLVKEDYLAFQKAKAAGLISIK